MKLKPLAALVRKDLHLFLHDRRAVILAFAVPVILASFFAIVFTGGGGGSSGGMSRLSVAVVDLDDSELSRKLVTAIDSDESLDVDHGSSAEVREQIRKGKAAVAILIPKGFGESAPRSMFAPGEKPSVTLLYDPTHSAELGIARGLLTRHVMETVSSEAFSPRGAASIRDRIGDVDRSDLSAVDKAALKVLMQGVAQWYDRAGARAAAGGQPGQGGFSVPFDTKEEAVTSGDQEASIAPVAHAFGGMAVQFLLFSGIEAGIGLLTERQKGLWRRLRSAPVSKFTLLLARTLSATIISLMVLAVVFGFGAIVFHIRVVGNPIGFALVCLGTATTAASFGLLVASLGKTPQAARGLSVMAVLFMVMLGGAWVPTFVFPAWLQKITPIIPTRWAVDGFDATLSRAFSLAEVMPTVLVLFGFSAAFASLAYWRFRWEES
jgi:ABC-2 type transport system permease protein